MSKKEITLCVLALAMAWDTAFAQNINWRRRFYYDLDKAVIRYDLRTNREVMDSTATMLTQLMADTTVRNLRIEVSSSSSLEASDAYNSRLSASRTGAFLSELRKRIEIPYNILYVYDSTFDWKQLEELTKWSACPMKQEALDIICHTPYVVDSNRNDNRKKIELQKLGGGATYSYMEKYLFPDMRNTVVSITADRPVPAPEPPVYEPQVVEEPPVILPAKRHYIVGVKTNALYDLAMTPNIGLEFYAGQHFSVGLNWAYAWWKNDSKSFYWRMYGGDIEARYWFRPYDVTTDDVRKGFTGHHIGVYGLMTTYDFEFGGHGQQAPKWSYGAGISYGYSLGLTRRLNLDFTIGLGCLYGTYYKYDPSPSVAEDYYWISTNERKYWGPTKAEISLVWKIGR